MAPGDRFTPVPVARIRIWNEMNEVRVRQAGWRRWWRCC